MKTQFPFLVQRPLPLVSERGRTNRFGVSSVQSLSVRSVAPPTEHRYDNWIKKTEVMIGPAIFFTSRVTCLDTFVAYDIILEPVH